MGIELVFNIEFQIADQSEQRRETFRKDENIIIVRTFRAQKNEADNKKREMSQKEKTRCHSSKCHNLEMIEAKNMNQQNIGGMMIGEGDSFFVGV